jgi:hypothetical protein
MLTILNLTYYYPVAKDDSKNRAVSNTIQLTYGSCQSIVELLSPNDDFLNSTITLKASDAIRASDVISGNSKVIYHAGSKIELLSGFSTTAGSVFTAKIQGCDN